MKLDKYTQDTITTSRSKYQLQHFVIGQHPTAPMRWRQIILEAQNLAYAIRSAELSVEKNKIEIYRLLSTGDPIDAIDAEQKHIDNQITERTLAGARIELGWLEEIAAETGAFTFDEIETDQPTYWAQRLQRQADLDRLSAIENVTAGNLTSMLNAGLLTYQENQCSIQPGN